MRTEGVPRGGSGLGCGSGLPGREIAGDQTRRPWEAGEGRDARARAIYAAMTLSNEFLIMTLGYCTLIRLYIFFVCFLCMRPPIYVTSHCTFNRRWILNKLLYMQQLNLK
jgi:hypothetical protein